MESNTSPNKNVQLASNKKVILWLIFFFPYGLYLMWRKTNWNKILKIGISALFAILCAVALFGGSSEDEEVKSASGINKLEIAHFQDVNLDLSKQYENHKQNYVNVNSEKANFSPNDLEFISKDEKIATLEVKELRNGKIYFDIIGVSAGETTIFVQTKDGLIKSNEVKVICTGEIPTTTEPTTVTTTEPTTQETTTKEETKSSSSSSGAKKSSSGKSSSSKSSNKKSSNKSSSSNSGSSSSQKGTYILNTNTKVFHKPGCRHIKTMNDENKEVRKNASADEIKDEGYKPCGTCLKNLK